MFAQIRRVAIVGAGAMGGMYGAHFARGGFDVALIASDERARRLRESGLRVNGDPLVAKVVDPTAEPPRSPADLVIFAVKDRHLEDTFEDAAAVIGDETIILSVMNGLDSEDRIAAKFGSERVLLTVALGMDAQRDDQSVRYRQAGRLLVGHATNGPKPSPMLKRVQDALTAANLAWQTPTDMRQQIWWKFMVNTGINQASAIMRAPYGLFQQDGDAHDLMLALMAEVCAVSAPEGVPLGPEDIAAWEEVLAGMPPGGWTSMRQDVAAERETEVETFAGQVVALGRKHGIPTPYNQAALWTLRGAPGLMGARS